MNWDATCYVVDTNTLTQLSRPQRATDLFHQSVRIPRAVLAEASGLPDIDELTALEYRTTPSVLRCLIAILETVPPTDTDLLDLYKNLGNADPFLVACALDGREKEQGSLFPRAWIVVTDDGAARKKAEEFELVTLSNQEFAERILTGMSA